MRRLVRTWVRGVALVWCIAIVIVWFVCRSHDPKVIVWWHRTQVFTAFYSWGVRLVVEHDSRPAAVRVRRLHVWASPERDRWGSVMRATRWPVDSYSGEFYGGLGEPVAVGAPRGEAWGVAPPPFTAKVLHFAGLEAAWGDGTHPLFSNVEATFQGATIVPYWMLVCTPALLCVVPLGRYIWRVVKGRKPHACICAYDLRASPMRCPECGRMVTRFRITRPPIGRDLRRGLATFARCGGPAMALGILAIVWAIGPARAPLMGSDQILPFARPISVPLFSRVQDVTIPTPVSSPSSMEPRQP